MRNSGLPQSLIDMVSEIMVEGAAEEKIKSDFLKSKGVVHPRELSEAAREEYRKLDLKKKR